MKTKSLNQLKIWTILIAPTVVLLVFFKVWIKLIMGLTDDPSLLVERISAASPFLVIINHLLLAAILVFALKTEKLSLKKLGFEFNAFDTIGGVALGVALFLFQQFLTLPVLAHFGLFNYWTGFPGLTYVFGATLLGAFFKEAIFHGYGTLALEKSGAKMAFNLLITTVAFALFHYAQGWSGVISAAIMGFVLGLFYFKRRNLTGVIIANALANLLFILFMTFQS